MRHLLTLLEVNHIRDGKVIWKANDLKNVTHLQGDEFCLYSLFQTTVASTPTFYYIGLDNRDTLSVNDAMPSGLLNEPTTNGYSRQPVSSASGFTVSKVSGVYRATSLVVAFSATGGSYGPVKNVFLTNRIDNNGYLIASVALGSSRTFSDGDTFTLQFGLSLRDFS